MCTTGRGLTAAFVAASSPAGDDAAWQADNMLGSAATLLVVSAAGAFSLGVVLLLAARHHPAFVVRSAMVVQVSQLQLQLHAACRFCHRRVT